MNCVTAGGIGQPGSGRKIYSERMREDQWIQWNSSHSLTEARAQSVLCDNMHSLASGFALQSSRLNVRSNKNRICGCDSDMEADTEDCRPMGRCERAARSRNAAGRLKYSGKRKTGCSRCSRTAEMRVKENGSCQRPLKKKLIDRQ